jgi:hypothetical protein
LGFSTSLFAQDKTYDPSVDIKVRRTVFPAMEISLEDPFAETIRIEEKRRANIAPSDTANAQINAILAQLAKSNKEVTKARGYRVQVYTGRDRDRALEIADSLQKETIEKVSYKFEAPYHKVKVGNYLSKLEAYQLYVDLSVGFEDAILVTDIIDIEKTPLDYMTDEDEEGSQVEGEEGIPDDDDDKE